MKTTVELVTAYRAAHGGSDRKAAVHMDVSQTTFSKWAGGEEFPSEERVSAMAAAIGADVQLALVVLRRDRAKSDSVRQVWQRIAEGLAVLVLTATPFLLPSPAQAQFDISKTQYTLRPKRRARSAFAAAVAALLMLTGCSMMQIDQHQAPPADWPELRVIEHRLTPEQLGAKCSAYVPWYAAVGACMEWHFAAGECHIYYNRDEAQLAFIREHELLHCAGHDHPGESTARMAWHRYSIGVAARAVADRLGAQQ